MVASWHCYFIDATSLYISFITKIEASIWFEDVTHMWCSANSQAKWSIPMFKFYNPMKINAFTSNVDQGDEIIEHTTFKRWLPTINMWYTSPS
jgi:hypothetical protein